tara:strand:+ start:460 stop:738 length:279 start_codon:yes stop_codon:yes gene_type:complete
LKGINMNKQKYNLEFDAPKGSFFGRMLYRNRMCDVHFFKGWNFNDRQQYDYICRYGKSDKYMSGLVSNHKGYQEKDSINLYSAFLKWKGNII